MIRALKWLLGIGVGLAVALAIAYFAAKAIWADTDPPPEYATGRRTVAAVRTSTTMAVAANPHAARAGHEMLTAGGSAVDAAVAMQAVLTVVEPQSSGIGGGAFMLYYDAGERAMTAYDGRETAPAAATSALFLHDDATPFNFVEAVVGGRSVGVPGAMRMLEAAHKTHGRLRWAQLFEPAIRLCEEGFEVSPRLHRLLRFDPLFRTQPVARAHFYQADGRALPVGHVLKNPKLARVLRAMAEQGADVLHEGELAEAIVATVRSAQRPSMTVAAANLTMIQSMGAPYGTGFEASVDNGGALTLEDLRGYRPQLRDPVCVDYRQWQVCGFGPPTSGGITTLQIIKMLESFDLAALSPRSAMYAHLFAEASKLAFADRARFIGDPDFVDVPTSGLLSAEYLRARSAQISKERAGPRASPGEPPGSKTTYVDGIDRARPSTSHLVVVDDARNVVSMTTSVENVFGSRLMVEGFVLNNQLTDFSFVPERNGRPVANAVAPGKRPRSSMSPLIILDRASNTPVAAVGSPGGSRIITYTARATLGMLDGGLSPQEAVQLPHIVNRNGVTELEDAGWAPGELKSVRTGLEKMGHDVKIGPQNSGLHAVRLAADGLYGGADPRREGVAIGN